jgi:hypothetical protein
MLTTIRFGLAAQAFAEVCRRIEDGEDNPLDPSTRLIFREIADNLQANAVDVFMLKAHLEEAMERCDQLLAGIKAKKKSLGNALDNLYDVVQENIKDKLKCDAGTIYNQDRKSVEVYLTLGYNNEVHIDDIKAKKIDARFIRQKTSYILDKKEVEAYLKVGQSLDWAKLVDKKSLVMRGVKKNDGLSTTGGDQGDSAGQAF